MKALTDTRTKAMSQPGESGPWQPGDGVPVPGSDEMIVVPTDEGGIDVLRGEIDAIDADILHLIQRRSAISHAIGAARRAEGGPRIVISREMAILDRFADLGPSGAELGMLLLNLGRGRLGRR